MNDLEYLVKMKDLFRESADIIDQLLVLREKGEKGEDVQKELEKASARYVYKMMEMRKLSEGGNN
ncbi:hypothetical protein BJV85_002091 [Clostridium acetobutylicum]|uniref:Uncharacterized protein n=1 Tax=Clostridium acetobutylicum (strain ATCC 824 / DSM 792 / JCM 1419 / IAM 19013 / LMG 5710 / NBRC 13948 / NRRL B-527 / VKM B-1787 / 2291 / W) TaxID=272562 RepID=Q97HV3_CLOAB|nr:MULTISPECIES: hypothetical protein [Clostridium]AAK79867.1 Hypothetical protein CA_C1904 [Clostridium acetobutylicum ATCC 824]ADZ20954.1 Conserved hypothetical protein [Clostridium acetobutylicum EA 2018]AEI32043.1 hypothetical protein SMB_G1930 [Clostridium acetobutylicum DSM 1731]AWV79703.1 hypothetical protein DK921_06235 [Clostridium acetobutylicum]MBC2394320.1 hypothetical protein [Clostridium acetobutylicum]